MLKCATMLVLITSTMSGQIIPIVSSKYDHGVTAKTDAGTGALGAREMLVNVTYPNGRNVKGSFIVLFDQPTGRYLWEFGQVMTNEQTSRMSVGTGTRSLTYVAADRIVKFGYAYPYLFAHESLGRANGIDDAEVKATNELVARLPAIQAYKTDDRVIMSLRKLLPKEFFFRTPFSVMAGPFKVVDFSRKGSTWEVILQGSWQEKITLNDKYQITGTVRIN
jgi:hypothetical protein